MTRVTYSPRAERDLEDIWLYTDQRWGQGQADRYTDEISQACLAIAKGHCLPRRAIGFEPYFKLSVGKHVVYFVHEDEGNFVVRVLHQSMDTNA